jgi:hypothetical protein
MTTMINKRATKRSLAVLLFLLLSLVLVSCESKPAAEDSWVVLESVGSDQPRNIYYVLENKSPYGDNEKNEDPSGYQRICHLLPFDKQSTTNSDGKSEYASLPASETEWQTCRLYKTAKKPSLVASSIPAEFADRIGAK